MFYLTVSQRKDAARMQRHEIGARRDGKIGKGSFAAQVKSTADRGENEKFTWNG